MTLLVRDEEDILESVLDFHLAKGVSYFLITDNLSSDRTPEIIARYVNCGVARSFLEQEDNYEQGKWVTRMAGLAYTEHGADWVINSDADEFWWPLAGDIPSTFDRLDPGVNRVKARRFNFPPVADATGRFWERQVVRDAVSFSRDGSRLPPKVCHRGSKDIVVHQGNHRVYGDNYEAAFPQQSPLVIFHFPLRSYEQFENKIRLGGAAYERNQKLPSVAGRHWRNLYDLHKRGLLRGSYEGEVLTPEVVESGVDSGRLIRDVRLKTFLEQI